jgi:hypothetical protein
MGQPQICGLPLKQRDYIQRSRMGFPVQGVWYDRMLAEGLSRRAARGIRPGRELARQPRHPASTAPPPGGDDPLSCCILRGSRRLSQSLKADPALGNVDEAAAKPCGPFGARFCPTPRLVRCASMPETFWTCALASGCGAASASPSQGNRRHRNPDLRRGAFPDRPISTRLPPSQTASGDCGPRWRPDPDG